MQREAVDSGVLGQLSDLIDEYPDTAKICWQCHTPLAEQQNVLLSDDGKWIKNPDFSEKLQHQGLVCAACHVRQHQRFGPPRTSSPDITGKISTNLPHNGFTADTAFSKSAFCKGCHQFGPDDFALNGKLIENTYNEWKESQYPAKNVQCQTCHMPQRKHRWRGIHDVDMVKNAVTIKIDLPDKKYNKGDTVNADITVANTGAGHYFPTYMTPKVFIRGHLLDADGNIIEDSRQEAIIGRDATLDLSEELYDTRIPPGKELTVTYSYPLSENKMQLKITIIVEPDHFYEKFYEAVIDNDNKSESNRMLSAALETTRQSSFNIFDKKLSF